MHRFPEFTNLFRQGLSGRCRYWNQIKNRPYLHLQQDQQCACQSCSENPSPFDSAFGAPNTS